MGTTCSSGTHTTTLSVNLSYTELDFPQKILMVGPSGAGKTQLLYSWKLGCSNVVKPMKTSDFNVEHVNVASGNSFMVFDLSGSPSFRVRRRQFYQGTEGIVFVVNSASTAKDMDDAKQDLVSVLHERNLCEKPLLVIGNKQDLKDALPIKDLEIALGLKATMSATTKRAWKMIGLCSLDEESVQFALDTLTELTGRSQVITTRTDKTTARSEIVTPRNVVTAWTNRD